MSDDLGLYGEEVDQHPPPFFLWLSDLAEFLAELLVECDSKVVPEGIGHLCFPALEMPFGFSRYPCD